MAEIELTPESLIVHITGTDRLWALKSRLEIPLQHVTGAASAAEEARKWWHGVKLGGTHLPGVITAGRFYEDGALVFWDVHDPEKAIGIDLADERYARLIIEVEDPGTTLAALTRAIS